MEQVNLTDYRNLYLQTAKEYLEKISISSDQLIGVFSTFGQEKDIVQAQKLGANSYINKGFFDFNYMVETINQIMKSGTN